MEGTRDPVGLSVNRLITTLQRRDRRQRIFALAISMASIKNVSASLSRETRAAVVRQIIQGAPREEPTTEKLFSYSNSCIIVSVQVRDSVSVRDTDSARVKARNDSGYR